jgi:WD40 repeat protein
VAGEPNATDKPESGLLEAFPPPIRFRVSPDGVLTDDPAEPLAADVRKGKDARTDAKLKLVAGIVGIGFDELKRREARRQLHQRLQLSALTFTVLLVIAGVWWNRQQAFESQRQIALAQRLIDQSTELLDSESDNAIERGVLLILQAMTRLDRPGVSFSEDGEAAQARLAADQNLRRALSLFYTHGVSLSPTAEGGTYEDRGWKSWSAEAASFSPDGTVLTAASGWGSGPTPQRDVGGWTRDMSPEAQEIPSGSPIRVADTTDRLNCRYFALSPDGEYLVTIASLVWIGEPNAATVYHLPLHREVARLAYKGDIRAVALGPGGEYLAIVAATVSGQPLPLQVWHVPSTTPVAGVPDDAVPAVECEQRIMDRSKPCPTSLAFSADNRYRAGRRAVTVGVAEESPNLWCGPPEADLYRGQAVAFSPDGLHLAAMGREATSIAVVSRRHLRLVCPGGTGEIADIHGPPVDAVRGLALSVGAKYLAIADGENSLLLRALASGRSRRVHFSHRSPDGTADVKRSPFVNLSGKGPGSSGRLFAVAFSRRGDLMAMAGEVDAVVWRISSFDEQAVLNHEDEVAGVAFDSDERTATTVSRTTYQRRLSVRAWDLESGRERPERRSEQVADAFKFTPTGDLVLAVDDDRAPGAAGRSPSRPAARQDRPLRYEGDVQKILFSQGGEHMALASSLGASSPLPVSPGRRQVAVWHLGTRSPMLRFDYTTAERDAGGPQAFFIIGSRWYLGVEDASGTNGSRYVLWEMNSRQESQERTDDIMLLWRQDVAISADQRWRAVEGGGEIRVFTVPNEREIARIPVALADKDPFRLVSRVVALSPRGRYAAAVTAKSTVRIWPIALSRMLSVACSRLPRDLTPEEWTQYLPTEVPKPTCQR